MKRSALVASIAGLFLCIAATTPSEDFTIPISVSPKVLVLDSQGGTVSVHTGIAASIVDRGSVTMEIDGGVCILDPYAVFADSRGQLVAKFFTDDAKDCVHPGPAAMELKGRTLQGATFSGSETILVR